MKAEVGKLEKRVTITATEYDREYVEEQISEYLEDLTETINEVIENRETWEDGAGTNATLRATRGKNDIAGRLSLCQYITWTPEEGEQALVECVRCGINCKANQVDTNGHCIECAEDMA